MKWIKYILGIFIMAMSGFIPDIVMYIIPESNGCDNLLKHISLGVFLLLLFITIGYKFANSAIKDDIRDLERDLALFDD